RRIKRRKQTEQYGYGSDKEDIEVVDLHGQGAYVVDIARKLDNLEVCLDLQEPVADERAEKRAEDTDCQAFRDKDAHDAPVRGAHGLENGDILLFLHDGHHQS